MIDKVNSINDLIIMTIITVIAWLFLGSIDGFEMILEFLESHDDWELDELLLLLMIIGFFSIFYSIRRVRESARINNQLKQLNEKLEERVEAELNARKENEAILLQQSKMAAMGEMIGNIAHQWRQPLNAIGLVIQNIQTSYDMDDLDDEFMERSVKKANFLTSTMSKTIDDFRYFFHPNKEKVSFDLNETVSRTINMIDGTFEHNNIKLEFNNTSKTIVHGHSNEISQTIINVLNNAKDALIEKNIKDARVKLHVENDGVYGKVVIEDNAGGIPLSIIEKIFEPYFTTKDEGKGTGIGLYMSKIIIEQNMNGLLEVENTQNGARFEISIPLYKDES